MMTPDVGIIRLTETRPRVSALAAVCFPPIAAPENDLEHIQESPTEVVPGNKPSFFSGLVKIKMTMAAVAASILAIVALIANNVLKYHLPKKLSILPPNDKTVVATNRVNELKKIKYGARSSPRPLTMLNKSGTICFANAHVQSLVASPRFAAACIANLKTLCPDVNCPHCMMSMVVADRWLDDTDYDGYHTFLEEFERRQDACSTDLGSQLIEDIESQATGDPAADRKSASLIEQLKQNMLTASLIRTSRNWFVSSLYTLNPLLFENQNCIMEFHDFITNLQGGYAECPNASLWNMFKLSYNRTTFCESCGDCDNPIDSHSFTLTPKDVMAQGSTLQSQLSWSGNTCIDCNGRKQSTTTFNISPDILTVAIIRNHFNADIRAMEKDDTRTYLPMSLEIPSTSGLPSSMYRLISFSYHRGDATSGHYAACVYNRATDEWTHRDDSHSMPISRLQAENYMEAATTGIYERTNEVVTNVDD